MNRKQIVTALMNAERLCEKIKRANVIQHSGRKINAEDWSELYQLETETIAAVQVALKQVA